MTLKIRTLLAGALTIMALASPARADDATTQAAATTYKGFQAGDILVRGRMLAVMPSTTSSVSGIGGTVNASNSFEPEVDGTYFFTSNLAVEAIAAVTSHHLRDSGSTAGTVDLGHVSLLPPTITGQYHFMPASAFSPYVGAGINYTFFFDSSLPANSAAKSITYENEPGGAIQAGFDYHLTGNWYANMDVKHLFLSTKAKVNGGAIAANVTLDPTIAGIGIGYKF